MARLLVMIVATFFDVLIIIGIKNSDKYETLIDSMSDSLLSELQGIGLFAADSKLCFFKKSFTASLRKKTVLIYGEKYADYYAYTALSKALTYIILIMGLASSVGVLFGGTGAVFMFVVGLAFSAVAWNYCVISISDETKQRTEVCIAEFPDMVIKFALLINSGMVLREAWNLIAYSKDNILYRLMQDSCDEMNNGSSEIDSIYEFGVKTNCLEIRKFTASMIQGISKGNSELSIFLAEQAQEMLEHKKQILLQKGEKAAGKLLIPIGITFVGIILIIGVGAMQSMSF